MVNFCHVIIIQYSVSAGKTESVRAAKEKRPAEVILSAWVENHAAYFYDNLVRIGAAFLGVSERQLRCAVMVQLKFSIAGFSYQLLLFCEYTALYLYSP